MFRLIARRLLLGLLTLWVISLLVFAGTELLPGDVAAAILGREATEETLTAMRIKLGLDRPAAVRYVEWLRDMLRGEFGESLSSRASVGKILSIRFANTIYLSLYAAIVAVPLSLALGLLSAAYPNGWLDRMISTSTVFAISIPEFVIAVLLVMVFAVGLGWFPSVLNRPNWGDPLSMLGNAFLPMITLVLTMLAHMIRMTRAAMLDIMKTPYIEMALLKGAPKRIIIMRHALPNALGPILNVVALNLGYLVSGVVVVEVVFTYPGLGRMMVDAVAYRDVPQIQAVAMIFCTFYICLNILADLGAIVANPRLRYAR